MIRLCFSHFVVALPSRFTRDCLQVATLLIGLCASVPLVPAFGATLYWDGGTMNITTNGDGASAGGLGTWNTTTMNWDQGSGLAHVAWPNDTTVADFGGSAGTVTLGTTITAGGLQFDVGGYTVTGSTLTMTAGTVTTASGTTIISSVLAGSGGLTINGPGTLSLTAGNTFTGGITLNSGTLAISQGGSLGAATATASASSPAQLTFAGTSTFQIGNNSLLNTRPLTINSGVTATIDTGTTAFTTPVSAVGGVISGTGNLTKIGLNPLTLTGANTFTGTTAINAGTLIVNGNNSGAGAVSVNNSGSLLGGTGTLNGAVTVNGPASITGGTNGGVGTLNLTGGLSLIGSSGSLATYIVDVSGVSADKLAITGNLNLSTAFDTLTVNVASAATQGSYAIATFTGTLSGTFDTTTLPSGYSLTYGTHEIDLVTPVPEPVTWLAGALLVGAATWRGRKCFRQTVAQAT